MKSRAKHNQLSQQKYRWPNWFFFILARHIFGHHWPNFIPFIPPDLPKTLIFRVYILLDFRAISPHETRLYWPGAHQYAITKGSAKRKNLTGVANLWAGGGIGGVCSGNSGLGFFFTSRTFNISATACKIDRTWCCAIVKEILLRLNVLLKLHPLVCSPFIFDRAISYKSSATTGCPKKGY